MLRWRSRCGSCTSRRWSPWAVWRDRARRARGWRRGASRVRTAPRTRTWSPFRPSTAPRGSSSEAPSLRELACAHDAIGAYVGARHRQPRPDRAPCDRARRSPVQPGKPQGLPGEAGSPDHRRAATGPASSRWQATRPADIRHLSCCCQRRERGLGRSAPQRRCGAARPKLRRFCEGARERSKWHRARHPRRGQRSIVETATSSADHRCAGGAGSAAGRDRWSCSVCPGELDLRDRGRRVTEVPEPVHQDPESSDRNVADIVGHKVEEDVGPRRRCPHRHHQHHVPSGLRGAPYTPPPDSMAAATRFDHENDTQIAPR